MIESMVYGRLAQDPTVRQTANGGQMTTFDVASNREYGDKTEADYMRCLAFGKLGEYVAKYGAKGKSLIVFGEEQHPKYVDKNGNRQTGNQLIVSKVKFTSWDPVENENPQTGNGQQQPTGRAQASGGYGGQRQQVGGYSPNNNGYAPRGGYSQQQNGYGNQNYGQPAAPDFMDVPGGMDEEIPFN